MELAHVSRLESFGTRSLVVHGAMVLTFAGALVAGLFLGGQVGLVSFVALLNFTAGLWVAHSVHSLGNATTDDEYDGVVNELFDTETDADDRSETTTDASDRSETTTDASDRSDAETDVGDRFDTGRFGRLLALISAVTAISLLTSVQVLGGVLFSVAVVAVGAIAVVTAMIGFMIALGAAYDESEGPVADSESTVESDPVDVRSLGGQ